MVRLSVYLSPLALTTFTIGDVIPAYLGSGTSVMCPSAKNWCSQLHTIPLTFIRGFDQQALDKP
ncbi:hypothetical protein M404DRAFT_996469 [Pisolithus tinctorius Marx 270]|uniref:Uncharacterized protein n=1 Tax=Pisolithus tinctorius Marx 270 TaxID=870435 RepID=A0A0C3JKH3_PISTI|nr:hypothetical protein M404DRAFT_996469 [Pisolithus tinctorius Marx 270]